MFVEGTRGPACSAQRAGLQSVHRPAAGSPLGGARGHGQGCAGIQAPGTQGRACARLATEHQPRWPSTEEVSHLAFECEGTGPRSHLQTGCSWEWSSGTQPSPRCAGFPGALSIERGENWRAGNTLVHVQSATLPHGRADGASAGHTSSLAVAEPHHQLSIPEAGPTAVPRDGVCVCVCVCVFGIPNSWGIEKTFGKWRKILQSGNIPSQSKASTNASAGAEGLLLHGPAGGKGESARVCTRHTDTGSELGCPGPSAPVPGTARPLRRWD